MKNYKAITLLILLSVASLNVNADLQVFKKSCDNTCLQAYSMGWLNSVMLKGDYVFSCRRDGKKTFFPVIGISGKVASRASRSTSNEHYSIILRTMIELEMNKWTSGCDQKGG